MNLMQLLFLLIVFSPWYPRTDALLIGSVSSLLTPTGRNLTCFNRIMITYNGTTTYDYVLLSINSSAGSINTQYMFGAAYCVFYQITVPVNGAVQ